MAELDTAIPESVAAKVIRLLGPKRIAAKCDLTTNAVYKWPTREGGLIPARYQRPVLDLASEMGIPLTADDVVAAPLDSAA